QLVVSLRRGEGARALCERENAEREREQVQRGEAEPEHGRTLATSLCGFNERHGRAVRIMSVVARCERHETLVDAADLESGERRPFRLDRITRAEVLEVADSERARPD